MENEIVKRGDEVLRIKAWWEDFFSRLGGVDCKVLDGGKMEMECTIKCDGFAPFKSFQLIDLSLIESRLPSELAQDLRRCRMKSRHVHPSSSEL